MARKRTPKASTPPAAPPASLEPVASTSTPAAPVSPDWKKLGSRALFAMVTIGTLAQGLGGAVTAYDWFLRKTPHLTHVLNGVYPWTNFGVASDPAFSVNYADQTFKYPYDVCSKLVNTGPVPIEGKDAVTPFFLPVEGARIGYAGIKNVLPRSIRAEARLVDGGVQINFAVLNPGDMIHFEILTDGMPTQVGPAQFQMKGLSEVTFVDRRLRLYPERPSFALWFVRSLWKTVTFLVALNAVAALVWVPLRLKRKWNLSSFKLWRWEVSKTTWATAWIVFMLLLIPSGWNMLAEGYRKDMDSLGVFGLADAKEFDP